MVDKAEINAEAIMKQGAAAMVHLQLKSQGECTGSSRNVW